MKRHVLSKLFATLLLCTVSWSLFGASSPTANDGKWYFVKSQRGPSVSERWWTVGADGFVSAEALTKSDNQKFTLVNASEGNVTFNNLGTGFTMTYDAKHMKFVGTTPVETGWTLTSNVVDGIQGWAFPGELTGLHQGNGGAPDYFRVMGTWYQLDDHCTFFFYEATADVELQFALEAAQIAFNKAVVGVAPGNYPAYAKQALGDAIVAAQGVLGSTEPTTITDAVSALNSALATFETTKVSLAAATPVANDGKWYYVRSQRSANSGNDWWTLAAADGSKAIPGAMTKSDNQKFTLVTSSPGKVAFKSFDGRVMGSDGGFVAVGTTVGWTLTSQTTQIAGVQGWSFPGESSGLHQGAGGWNWEVRSGYYNLADNCSYFFFGATQDIDLQIKVAEVATMVATAAPGTRPGSTPQSAIDALGVALNAAKGVLGSTDEAAINSALADLTAAVATFNESKIAKVKVSTAEAPIWYLIKSGNPASPYAGSGIYTTGENTQCKWGATNPMNANLLWRFEKHATNDTYKIINAAYPSGDLSSVSYGTAGTYWNFQLYPGDARGFQYKIYNGGTTLHTEGGTYKLVSWTGSDGYDGSSAWMFEEVDLVSSLTQSVAAAKIIHDNAVVGSKAGQYPQADKDVFLSAITSIETWLTGTPNPSPADLFSKMQELGTATTVFNSAKIAPFEIVVPNGKYYLQTLDGKFVTAIGAKDRQGAGVVDTYTDSCRWDITRRGEANSYGITFGGSAENFTDCILFLDELFRWRDTRMGSGSAYGLNEWTEQRIYADQATWTSETVFAIQSPAPGGGYHVYNPETRKFTTNSTTPVFNLRLIEISAVGQINADTQATLRAIVINNAIVVTGVHDIDVYTITGMKIQNKNLKAGVYVVKANGQTFKVSVK